MKRLVLSSICLMALVCAANATDIYNNLVSPQSFFDGVCPGPPPPPTTSDCFGPLANSFRTGPFHFELNSVGVLLSGDPTTGGTTSVELLSNNAGRPGTLILQLGTVSDASLSSTFAPVFFDLSAAIPLAPNTRYWIGLSDISLPSIQTSAEWAVCDFAVCGTDVGVPGEFFANGNGVFPNDESPYQMEVGGVVSGVIPEPSSFLLLGSGLLGLVGAVRRRRLS